MRFLTHHLRLPSAAWHPCTCYVCMYVCMYICVCVHGDKSTAKVCSHKLDRLAFGATLQQMHPTRSPTHMHNTPTHTHTRGRNKSTRLKMGPRLSPVSAKSKLKCFPVCPVCEEYPYCSILPKVRSMDSDSTWVKTRDGRFSRQYATGRSGPSTKKGQPDQTSRASLLQNY
jgi:hypothetical protein